MCSLFAAAINSANLRISFTSTVYDCIPSVRKPLQETVRNKIPQKDKNAIFIFVLGVTSDHTQLAIDNLMLTFVGGWVFTCDVILKAV